MIERILITISALIVFSIIGWVSWEAIFMEKTRPSFAFTILESSKAGDAHQVLFEVTNSSSQTAADVVVRGEILEGRQAVEAVDITFDFLPGNSRSSGAILFSKDPGALLVTLRAVGYIEP